MKKLREIPRFYIDIFFLFAAEVLWAIGSNMYMGQLSVYMNGIVHDPRLVSFIQSIANFSGILAIFGGFLTRRVNLKWLVVLCWAVTVPAPLLFALAQDAFLLILGQSIYSLTTMFGPAVILYIFDYDYPTDKLRVYLLYCLVSQIASVTGPAIGGTVATALGMRGMLMIVFVLFTLASLSTLAMSKAVGKAQPEPLPKRSERAPFSLREHLKAYGTLYGWMLLFVLLPAIETVAEPLISVYLTDHRGFTTAQIGYGFTLTCLGGVLLTMTVRKWGKSVPILAVMALLSALFAAADLGFMGTGFALMLCMLTLRGAARTTVFFEQGTFTELSETAGPHKGMFVSAFIALRSLAMTAANNLGGVLYTRSPTAPFAAELLGCAVWLAAFALFFMRQRKKA